MKPITIWKKYNDKAKDFKHNHIEDGYVSCFMLDNPIGKFKEQTKAWSTGIWQATYGFLNDKYTVVRL